MRRRNAWSVALVLLLAAGGCTEPDDTVVVDIGTTVVTFADSDLRTQIVEVTTPNTPYTIQVMEWNVEELLLSGLTPGPIDLLFDDPVCGFLDTAFALPRRNGKCGAGVIIDADGETRQVTLQVKTRAKVRRLAPLILPPGDDSQDGDGVVNEDDNCPLEPNPDQLDTGNKGFGDACATFDAFFGLVLPDNDRDFVADIVDNCPYTKNSDQADDGIEYPPGSGFFVLDGIGNACEQDEQTADVFMAGSTTVDLNLGPVNVLQPFRSTSFLNVEFRDQAALQSPCLWIGGSCTLDPMQVLMCFELTGSFGCR